MASKIEWTEETCCGPENNDVLTFFERRERYYRRQCLGCGHGLGQHGGPCRTWGCRCEVLEEYHRASPGAELPDAGGLLGLPPGRAT